MHIFVLGIWDRFGGASGECLGAVQLWRRNGLDVTLIPTWGVASTEAKQTAHQLGCNVIEIGNPRRIESVPGLAGSTVVAFCNDRALACKTSLRKLKCRLIFAPCMCYPDSALRTAVNGGYVYRMVYQSEYQRKEVEFRLRNHKYDPSTGYLVRGYLDWESIEFQPVPHEPGTPFVIGRIARDSGTKWNVHWWDMYERVPNRKAVLLGFGHQAARLMGPAPEWANAMPPGKVPAAEVYRQLHAFVTCNGQINENWPRTGLEAMAYGVPLVTEKAYGWLEMIEDGVTGLMGETWEEVGDLAAALAEDESRRLEMARAARERLAVICDADAIWEQWREVLDA